MISCIFTLWLKLGFHYFHYNSNTITDNYNWYFAKKLETFQDSNTCQESKIDKNYGRYSKNKMTRPKKNSVWWLSGCRKRRNKKESEKVKKKKLEKEKGDICIRYIFMRESFAI